MTVRTSRAARITANRVARDARQAAQLAGAGDRKAEFLAGFNTWVAYGPDDAGEERLWRAGWSEAAHERWGKRPTTADGPGAWKDFVKRTLLLAHP